MKNIVKFNTKTSQLFAVPVLVFMLVFSSCEKNIDLQPFNQVSETAAFQTPELIALTVAGMYEAAQMGYYANPTVSAPEATPLEPRL